MPTEDARETCWDFDRDPADAVNDGNLDKDYGTTAGDTVAHDAPHGEPADDTGELYWDFEGDPADAVDDGDQEGDYDTSDGGAVDGECPHEPSGYTGPMDRKVGLVGLSKARDKQARRWPVIGTPKTQELGYWWWSVERQATRQLTQFCEEIEWHHQLPISKDSAG